MDRVRGRQGLTGTQALTVVVGAMVGSGILVLLGLMLDQARSAWLVVLALAAGGILSILGCLTFAELASRDPRAGGPYQYLRDGLGPVWGYLYGWTMFWVVLTGLLAAIAAGFAGFVGYFLPLGGHTAPLVVGGWDTHLTLPPWGLAFVAIALIWSLVALNALGTRVGGWISNATTAVKVAALTLFVAAILAFGHHADPAFASADGPRPFDGASVGGFAAALVFALFAFDGWVAVTYIASEVRDAARTLPRALIVGPLLVAGLYILVAVASFVALPPSAAIAAARDPRNLGALVAAEHALGRAAVPVVAAFALVALAGTANAFVLTVPRIFVAMARDGLLWAGMGRLSGRAKAPRTATMLLALWSSILVLSGLYASLVYLVVFGQWLFYALAAIAHMRLRRRNGVPQGAFRTPAYPVVPILFLLAATFVLVGMVAQPGQRAYVVLSCLLTLVGLPFYLAQRRKPVTTA